MIVESLCIVWRALPFTRCAAVEAIGIEVKAENAQAFQVAGPSAATR